MPLMTETHTQSLTLHSTLELKIFSLKQICCLTAHSVLNIELDNVVYHEVAWVRVRVRVIHSYLIED